MTFLQKARQLVHTTPLENAKGGLKGQLIHLSDPDRYEFLTRLRPNREELTAHTQNLVSMVSWICMASDIPVVKVFGRVKTIGSLDRQERRARMVYPDSYHEFVADDLIGICVVVPSRDDCYTVLDIFNMLGVFPTRSKSNPVDFMFAPIDSLAMPDASKRETIQGTMKIEGVPVSVSIRICTLDTFRAKKEYRGQRIAKVWDQILTAEKTANEFPEVSTRPQI